MTARRIVGTLLLPVWTASCRARVPEGAAAPRASDATVTTADETASEVAVTVDDLPVHGPLTAGTDRLTIANRVLSAFQRHRLPAVYGFVNGKRVVDDPSSEAVLRRWKVFARDLEDELTRTCTSNDE